MKEYILIAVLVLSALVLNLANTGLDTSNAQTNLFKDHNNIACAELSKAVDLSLNRPDNYYSGIQGEKDNLLKLLEANNCKTDFERLKSSL